MAMLQDRVIIVTGGGHGLGKAYSKGMAEEGARILVVDQDGPAAEQVAEEIRQTEGQAVPFKADVSDEAQVMNMAKEAADRFGGRIDGIVNNAAIFKTIPTPPGSLEDMTVDNWDKVMDVNVRGVFLCCKAVVPYMKEQNYGKIVNISSTTALQGLSAFGPYMVSKAAVVGITRGLARDLGKFNITVNGVAPGGTMSEDEVTQDVLQRNQSTIDTGLASGRLSGVAIRAIRRVEVPEDLTGIVLFLVSPASDFISGQTISVDGGSYMG
jgi:3-oxoacyl-[acyl-carrier protein] reductase